MRTRSDKPKRPSRHAWGYSLFYNNLIFLLFSCSLWNDVLRLFRERGKRMCVELFLLFAFENFLSI